MTDKTNEDKRLEAIREAQLEAAIGEVVDAGADSGEHIIETMSDDKASTTAFVRDRRSIDTVEVFNQHTGEASNILLTMLAKHLRRRFPSIPSIPQELWGMLAFKLDVPSGLPERENHLCYFHPDSSHKAGLEAIGLAGRVCAKRNMPSELEVELHVDKKHPMEMKRYRANKAAAEKAEDRELRLAEVRAMQEIAAGSSMMNQQTASEDDKKEDKD